MRILAAAAVFLLLAACGEQVREAYPTWDDARRAGAAERGWIPAFVPSSAREISDSHDLDSNRQTLRFTVPPSAIPAMVEALGSLSMEDEDAAAQLLKEQGLPPGSETYVVCSGPLNGALVVDRKSGRAVYSTGIGWAEDDCAGALTARLDPR